MVLLFNKFLNSANLNSRGFRLASDDEPSEILLRDLLIINDIPYNLGILIVVGRAFEYYFLAIEY